MIQAQRRSAGGQPGDSLFALAGGDLVVVGAKLPADLHFNCVTSDGAIIKVMHRVSRTGLVHNDDGRWRIVSVPIGQPYSIIWVTGPSARRRDILERSPWTAVRRYVRWRTGWRGRLRAWLGLR